MTQDTTKTNPQAGAALLTTLVVLLALCLLALVALVWLSRDRIAAQLESAAAAMRSTPAQVEEPKDAKPEDIWGTHGAPSAQGTQDSAPAAASEAAPPAPVRQQPLATAPTQPPAQTGAPATLPPVVPEAEVKPGNPVVARVGDREIRRVEVLEFIAALPADVREGRGAAEIFPEALAEMVDTMVVDARVADSDVGQAPEVAAQLAEARARIERSVYLQQQVAARVTEADVRAAYDAWAAQAQAPTEMRVRHILVPTRAEAEQVIEALDAGRSFEALAIAHSTGPRAAQGGDLGYFTADEVVPEFGAAAQALELGAYSAQPVQTELGWHVLQVTDRRARPVPGFEAVRAEVERAVQAQVLGDLLGDWRAQADAALFGINGAPAPAPQEEEEEVPLPAPLFTAPTPAQPWGQ
jgi:peptidyl-prolyl cis-trans isomerase C